MGFGVVRNRRGVGLPAARDDTAAAPADGDKLEEEEEGSGLGRRGRRGEMGEEEGRGGRGDAS
jgi:hypothetical protein